MQCEAREFTEDEKLAIEKSDELAEFIRNVAQRFVICQRYHLLITVA